MSTFQDPVIVHCMHEARGAHPLTDLHSPIRPFASDRAKSCAKHIFWTHNLQKLQKWAISDHVIEWVITVLSSTNSTQTDFLPTVKKHFSAQTDLCGRKHSYHISWIIDGTASSALW